MGFEHAAFSITEGNGSVEVCVYVKSGVLQSSLNLSFTTVDGDAICEQCCTLNVYPNIYRHIQAVVVDGCSRAREPTFWFLLLYSGIYKRSLLYGSILKKKFKAFKEATCCHMT